MTIEDGNKKLRAIMSKVLVEFYQVCWRHQFYLKETVLYEFSMCYSSLISILTCNRYDSCFNTVTHILQYIPRNNKHLPSWTKYLEVSKKIKQNWTIPGNFEMCFCVNFNYYYQKFISRKLTGHQHLSPPNLSFFKYFLVS